MAEVEIELGSACVVCASVVGVLRIIAGVEVVRTAVVDAISDVLGAADEATDGTVIAIVAVLGVNNVEDVVSILVVEVEVVEEEVEVDVEVLDVVEVTAERCIRPNETVHWEY